MKRCASKTLDANFTVQSLRTIVELEGRLNDEELDKAIQASKSAATSTRRVQFEQFKADLEVDQVCWPHAC
jgi:hypothetical protein